MSFQEYTHLFIWSICTVFHANLIKKMKPFTEYNCVVTSWKGPKYGNKNIVYARTRYPGYPKSTGCTYFEWIENTYKCYYIPPPTNVSTFVMVLWGMKILSPFSKGVSYPSKGLLTRQIFTRRKGDIFDENSDLLNFTRWLTSTGCHLRHAKNLHYCFSFILGTFKYDINPKGLSIKQF